jgi:hypothetical protein
MNNWCIVFSRIFLLGILVFKGLTARRLYKSFGVKGLIQVTGVLVFRNKAYASVSVGSVHVPEGITKVGGC